MTRSILLLAIVLLSSPVFAQASCETNCAISPASAFDVFTEADVTAVRYVVLVNGVEASLEPVVSGGLVSFRFASGLSRGSYSFSIVAYDPAGEAWRSDANTLTVKPGNRKTKFR